MPAAPILGSRFGRLAQALFNLNQPLTLDAADAIAVPSYSVDNPPADFKTFAGVDMCGGSFLTAVLGGQFSQAALLLPATAGKIAVVKRITIQSTAALTFQMAIAGSNGFGAAPAAGNTAQLLDWRRIAAGGIGRAACILRTATTAALSTANFIYSTRNVAATTVEFPYDLVISPSPGFTETGLLIEATTVAQAFTVSFQWEERVLGTQESLP